MESQNPTAPTNTPAAAPQAPAMPPATPPPVSEPMSMNTTPPKSGNKMIMMLVLVIVIVAVGGFGFMMLRNNFQPVQPAVVPTTPVAQQPTTVPPTTAPTMSPTPEIKSATDIDNELNSLDSEIGNTKSSDFDANSLSDL